MFSGEVDKQKRVVLLTWIFEIAHRFKYQSETTYLSVQLIDRYLSVESVSLKKLQLVGVTALFLASKYQEIVWRSASELSFFTKNAVSPEEIFRMELHMLAKLSFQVSVPTGFEFLERYWFVSDEET